MEITKKGVLAVFVVVSTVMILLDMQTSWVPQAFAQATLSDCEKFRDAQAVLSCALKNHPAVITAVAGDSQASELEDVAGQRPNPELDAKLTFGSSLGDSIVNTDTSLVHVWELGGKRDARIQKAQAEKALAAAAVLEAKENVTMEVVESLVHLRQLALEKSVLQEALGTFSQITATLRKRQIKNPEQQASYLIYDIAQNDYRLRQAGLESEERTERKKLEFATGTLFPIEKEILPKTRAKWPRIEAQPTSLAGAEWNRAQAEVQLEDSNLSVERGASWPDVRIGPAIQTETQATLTVPTFGFALALPLPLYQVNSAGRAHARLGILKAQLSMEATQKALKSEFDRELANYKSAVSALQSVRPAAELEREHRTIEGLIARGLVQSSLVIEAHRQMFDFTRSTHELELSALRSLLKMRRIEGRLLEEKI